MTKTTRPAIGIIVQCENATQREWGNNYSNSATTLLTAQLAASAGANSVAHMCNAGIQSFPSPGQHPTPP